MPELWTSEIIAEMHIHKIKQKDLAETIGWTPEYVSMILNGKKNPAGAYEKMMEAIGKIELERRTV